MTAMAHPARPFRAFGSSAQERWWERPQVLAAIALLAVVPLLLPEVPPLVDVPGHIGRYRVQLDLHSSADLQRYFDFHWALIGNLGVDLLVVPLASLLGLEPAVKLIVCLIPLLTVAGIFWVAYEVHGRVPPTALFAVPFVYGYPFNFGFINFAFSMAVALPLFALWLRLTRKGRLELRTAVFVPASCLLWLIHAFGWGALGLLAFSAELVRFRDSGNTWLKSAVRAGLQMTALALPLLLMIFWRSGVTDGENREFLNWRWKAYALMSALRDRWLVWDCFGVGAAVVLTGAAVFDRQLEFSRKLGIPAAVLLGVFLLLPYMLMGSAFADMRLAPFMLIVAILAIRLRNDDVKVASKLALAGLVFVLLRLGGNALSLAIAGAETDERLAALDRVPRGAAVLTLAAADCENGWKLPRHTHLGGFVIARKHGFANDQWQLAGAQLLRIRYTQAGAFADDTSTFVYSKSCLKKITKVDPRRRRLIRSPSEAMAEFPREAFDFVWFVEPPDQSYGPWPGLEPVWRGRDSILFRVESLQPPLPRPY